MLEPHLHRVDALKASRYPSQNSAVLAQQVPEAGTALTSPPHDVFARDIVAFEAASGAGLDLNL